MPRWPDQHIVDSAIFLYQTVEHADKGTDSGGSGFLVGLPWDDSRASAKANHVYAVTNYHVAVSGSASVIRLNTKDGKSASIQTEPTEWFWNHEHDIAIYRFDASKHFATGSIYDYKFSDFHEINLPGTTIKKFNLGVGDEVFSVGRFVDVYGHQKNTPLVRSGIIAATGELSIRADPSVPWDEESVWLVEMRSRTEFSGSPVFVFIDQMFTRLVKTEVEVDPWKFYGPWLLGIQSGQLPTGGPDAPDTGGAGMTTVVPCSALADLLLDHDGVISERAEYEERFLKSPKAIREAVPADARNPHHKEDFNRLLDAAVRVKRSDDQT